mgnify:CR=1 FL=1
MNGRWLDVLDGIALGGPLGGQGCAKQRVQAASMTE